MKTKHKKNCLETKSLSFNLFMIQQRLALFTSYSVELFFKVVDWFVEYWSLAPRQTLKGLLKVINGWGYFLP